VTGGWLTAFLLSVFVFSVLFFMFCQALVAPAHKARMFETRGIDISGIVVGRHQSFIDEKGVYEAPFLDYTYAPKELAGEPNPVVRVKRSVSEKDYLAFRVGAAVPLVYDPAHPDQAIFKSTVEAHRGHKDPLRGEIVLLLVTMFPGGVAAILSVYLLWKHLRERSLLKWGKAAEATVVVESEYVYKGDSRATISYTFRDDGGARRTGRTTISLGPAGDPRPFPDLIELPTAVYDPRNSARNVLYPGFAARLVE